MSYIGRKPSFSQVRTAELAIQRAADIATVGAISGLDVSNISLVRLTAATSVSSIVAPVSPVNNGKRVTIINGALSATIEFVNESTDTAANRIVTGTGRNLVLTAGASVTLFYNTATSRWCVESSSSEINIDRLKVAKEDLVLNSVDLTPTSAPKSSLLEIRAGTQTSIRSISTGVSGQFIAIVNKTGSLLQIANEDSGATPANRILTGTGGPISLQNNASLFLTYMTDSASASRWYVVGGTGSGGGATEQVTQTGIGSIAVGTPLYVDAVNGWVAANASAANTAEVAGMVGRSLGADLAEIVMAGEVAGVAASTFVENALPARGEAIFLSTTAGKLTWTEPSVVGQVSKPLGIVHNVGGSSVDIMFYNMRGSVVGGANLRTQIGLSNAATTTVQNAGGYDAGSIEGWVYIDGTTDYRFHVRAQFAKAGLASPVDYNLSYQTTGDTPPVGFSVSITSAGLIQVTLPTIAGFVAGGSYINFALNAPAVGTTLPLQIASGLITPDGSAESPRGWVLSTNADYTVSASTGNRVRITATSANRSLTLPSSSIKAGYEVEAVTACSGGFTVAIKASDASTIDTLKGTKGNCVLVALQDSPTTAAHWSVVSVYDEGSYTPTITPASGSLGAYTATFNFVRNNNVVTVSGGYFAPSSGDTGTAPLYFSVPYTPAFNGCGIGRRGGIDGVAITWQVVPLSATSTVWTYNNNYPFGNNADVSMSLSFRI